MPESHQQEAPIMSAKPDPTFTRAKAGEAAPNTGTARWLIVSLVIVAAGVLSAFYGINEYASGTDAIVKNANSNQTRFQAIFGDLVQARYRALNIAAETLLQSRVTTGAFARDDRAALVALMEPFYETLHKSHGIEQLNFWLPPAKAYYRAGSPQAFGMDLSAFRKSVVAANERRTRISAVETGLGGVIALRTITPVVVDDKFVGVFEFVSNFDIPLERASDTTGLKWAVSLMKEVSDRVERPADPKNDAWQGSDVYYRYSDPITAQTVRAIKFDPRSKAHSLATLDGRTVYVKTFPVVNFSGIATITVATLLDVTQPFAEVFRTAAIKSTILFLLAAILGSLAVIKFGQIKASLGGALSRQKKELDERILSCDAAVSKLREVDVIKRGFFTNLVTAVNEPLQAVVGQLKALPPAFEAAGASKQVIERLQFALSETTRLSRLVEDYQQIEMFRQKLVKSDYPAISLAAVVAKTLEEDLLLSLRLPQLSITTTVPADLPPTRADAGLLRRAIASLIGYASQRVGRGRIELSACQDDAKWLVLSITGSAFTNEGAPSEALLDESRQFMARLASGANQSENGGTLVSVVLARIIIEFYGGTLDISKNQAAPGFVVRLAAAA
jgi:signal transduction histidine kinase